MDYEEAFSPVVKIVTVRKVLSIRVVKGWDIQQMDFHNAFLQGDLTEKVYMQLPQSFHQDNGDRIQVCKLIKSLYGLKKASKQWNVKLTNTL